MLSRVQRQPKSECKAETRSRRIGHTSAGCKHSRDNRSVIHQHTVPHNIGNCKPRQRFVDLIDMARACGQLEHGASFMSQFQLSQLKQSVPAILGPRQEVAGGCTPGA